MSAVALDDAVNRGKPEPRAVTNVLGGEEGFEDAPLRGSIHADPGVGDGELDEVTIRCVRGLALLAGELLVCHINGDCSTLRHGLTRIDEEIQQHLLELRAIQLRPPASPAPRFAEK